MIDEDSSLQPPPNDSEDNVQVTTMDVDIDARDDATITARNADADLSVAAPSEPYASDIHPMIVHPVRIKRNIFALIIGINNYASADFRNLRGAVADAKAFQAYLENDLEIPKDQVRTLFDGEATREAIIQAFEDVHDDERIKENDSIVIFYAGHGGELPSPRAWSILVTRAKIQCLIPQDCNEPIVSPIPDRTIGALIDNIARKKGNNISVILDCCHSSSGTRVENSAYTSRNVALKCELRADLDRDIWVRIAFVAPGFARRGLLSHVLYAACGENEEAQEYQGRGLFTTELLKTLQKSPMDDLTYMEVLERLRREPFIRQSPQCEGVYRHRVIFDLRMPAGRHVRHDVRIVGGKCIFGAGLAHGIQHGVKFTLYDNQRQTVGEITVDETAVIGDFETTVALPLSEHPEDLRFAKLTRVGNLPIYPVPGGETFRILEMTLRRMEANNEIPTFRLVKAVEEAKLEVKIEKGQAALKVLDERLKRFGMTEISFSVKLDYLVHSLKLVAHYYWYLGLANEKKPRDSRVVVDFYPLENSEHEYSMKSGLPLLVPVKGPGFRTKYEDKDLGAIDIIDFVINEENLYGMKITNGTEWDLYVNAFLFNNSDLSIARYHTQSVGILKTDPPLRSNGVFTMGYGEGGTAPFVYSLEESRDIDVGYLKLYFSTQPIDLTDIEHVSPFSNVGDLSIDEGGRPARLKPVAPMDVWFTMDVPVVQRRWAKERSEC